jgi:signal transduction histidine kinase
MYEETGRLWHAPSGQYRYVVVRAVPLLGNNYSVREWVGSCTDVNREREAQQALREADQRKDEFLATLAHELRNPLAPIRQAATLLKSPKLTERDARWAREVIDRQVRSMSWLLDDLLDLSRISRGKVELCKENVGLATIVESAVETARPLIDAKQHRLHIDLARAPTQFEADPLRLSQVICNLLLNAAKYTDPQGDIHLQAHSDADELVITVRDTGIGISAEMLPRLFEMFSQARSSIDHADGGLGIGLALVRGFVELHGGTVQAHSAGPGFGSEFTLRLPLGMSGDSMTAAADSSAHEVAQISDRRR